MSKQTKKQEEKVNGYTNLATFHAALNIDNEETNYLYARSAAKRIGDNVKRLTQWFHAHAHDFTYYDRIAFSRVNWREIAQMKVDEYRMEFLNETHDNDYWYARDNNQYSAE